MNKAILRDNTKPASYRPAVAVYSHLKKDDVDGASEAQLLSKDDMGEDLNVSLQTLILFANMKKKC